MKAYLTRHAQVFFYSLGQLLRTPLASLMTVGVIGITLALPAGLYLLLENAERVTGQWEGGAQISLFLKPGVPGPQARQLAERLQARPEVNQVRYISPAEALEEFKRLSGFGEALDALDRNPLPPVLVVWPAVTEPARLEALLAEFRGFGEVDIAQLDLAWVKRLHAILGLLRRGVLLLAGLLAVAVLLIVGNTIRLAILNRKEEIEVIKLVGGTDAFVRRPFLYSGWLQGTAGGLAAWLLVSAGLALLAGPVRELALLYASPYALRYPSAVEVLALLGAGGSLGWLASLIAVGRHLRTIEPS